MKILASTNIMNATVPGINWNPPGPNPTYEDTSILGTLINVQCILYIVQMYPQVRYALSNSPHVRSSGEDSKQETLGRHPPDGQNSLTSYLVVVLIVHSSREAKVSYLDK